MLTSVRTTPCTIAMRMPHALTLRAALSVNVLKGSLGMEWSARVRQLANCSTSMLDMYVADVDECESDVDECSDNAECFDTIGSYDCTCISGYFGNGIDCEGKANPHAPMSCDAYLFLLFKTLTSVKATMVAVNTSVTMALVTSHVNVNRDMP